MSERDESARRFAAANGWGAAKIGLLAGDASNRRYLRLENGPSGASAVLMDAPPMTGEDTRPFVDIAEHLSRIGLSPPGVIASDPDLGFLLLEDLGDDLFARVLKDKPALEQDLYAAAIDVLGALHSADLPPNVDTYTPELMADLSVLSFDWYVAHVAMTEAVAGRNRLNDLMHDLLSLHAAEADVLILRDYHAENLLWFPQREGCSRVGLLDFQDAMAGHVAYDLVSLLQDARRDVSPSVAQNMLQRYIDQNGADPAAFTRAYHLLGVQRNLRIFGVFARLCIRDGKPHYLDFLPRVWSYLQQSLEQPELADLKVFLAETLPPPTPEVIEILRAQCATRQAQ